MIVGISLITGVFIVGVTHFVVSIRRDRAALNEFMFHMGVGNSHSFASFTKQPRETVDKL